MSDEDKTHTPRDGDEWIFECTECGEQWVDPHAPVTGHHCDRDPRAPGMPEGEAADVIVIQRPGGSDNE